MKMMEVVSKAKENSRRSLCLDMMCTRRMAEAEALSQTTFTGLGIVIWPLDLCSETISW